MAETILTPDGKLHVLLGSTTIETVIREYAGGEAAKQFHLLAARNAYEEARVETDLGAYENSLSHWRAVAQDWVEEIEMATERGRVTRQSLLSCLQSLKTQMKQEM